MNSLPLSYYSEEAVQSPLKVGLFTRILEMRSTLAHLSTIGQQAPKQKRQWLKENEGYLERILDTVTQDDPIQFEEPDMDTEMMKLLIEYTSVLQELVTNIQTLFHQHKARRVARARR